MYMYKKQSCKPKGTATNDGALAPHRLVFSTLVITCLLICLNFRYMFWGGSFWLCLIYLGFCVYRFSVSSAISGRSLIHVGSIYSRSWDHMEIFWAKLGSNIGQTSIQKGIEKRMQQKILFFNCFWELVLGVGQWTGTCGQWGRGPQRNNQSPQGLGQWTMDK